MSKRNGAKPVTQYAVEGYLPDAMVNYLARLGWSHGDDEIFSRSQFLEWFNLDHLGRSAAQFDEAKLRWVNAQHLKSMGGEALAKLVGTRLTERGIVFDDRLVSLCELLKDRCDTTVALADWVARFYGEVHPAPADLEQNVTDAVRPALKALAQELGACAWDKASISAAIKAVLNQNGLKMPQLAMAVRVLVLGIAQTPSLDAVLALLDRAQVLERLGRA
jgi:glutamyl-tRNA synthetase